MRPETRYTRTVTRRYTSKKTGKTKVYKYTYSIYKVKGRVRTRSKKHIVWRGKVTKYGEKWIQEYSKGLDISDRSELEAQVLRAERHNWSVTENSLKSRLMESRTAKYIYNMGGDVEELAEEFGIDERDLINDKYWDFNNSTFTFNGTTYQFYFDYDKHSIDWKVI